MLVCRKDLDCLVRMLRGLLGEGVREVFLNAAASSGVADFGFFGRGLWIDQPIASYGDFIVKHRFRPPSFPVAGELQYLRDGCPRQPRIRWDLQSRTTIPVFGKKFRAAAPLFKTALFSGSWAIDGASRPLTGRGVTMSAPYAVLIAAPSGITPSFA